MKLGAKRRCVGERLTHGVQEDGEEKFPPVDELVQLIWAARVVFVEDGVGEEAARLPGQHLQHVR